MNSLRIVRAEVRKLTSTRMPLAFLIVLVVIGAGIAGSSAAAELAADARVTLLEMEAQPGYHATGRSAAYFAPSYGHPIVRELAACSAPMFRKPPPEFTDVELFRPRDYVMFGRPDQAESLRREQEAESGLEWLDADDVQALVPVLPTATCTTGLRSSSSFWSPSTNRSWTSPSFVFLCWTVSPLAWHRFPRWPMGFSATSVLRNCCRRRNLCPSLVRTESTGSASGCPT